MFKKLIKAIDNLADAIDSLVEKLDAIFIESKQPLLTLGDGIQRIADAPVQEPKKTASRRRWTSKEDNIVIIGYSKGLAPAAISEILKQQGFDRSAHAIVDHMSELRKLMK
jgi:chemotaxis response regulator CheB